MAAKSRLDPAFEPADAFIGIATNMPATQLVHFINNITLLNLVREEDLPVYSEKTERLIPYRFFYYPDEDYRSEFCLVSNNNGGMNLLLTHKQFSFFLIVQGAMPDGKISQLVTQIKSITGVQLAAIISQEPIKSLGPILQDLELHLARLKKVKNDRLTRYMPLSENQ
jgi:hypothetical protein